MRKQIGWPLVWAFVWILLQPVGALGQETPRFLWIDPRDPIRSEMGVEDMDRFRSHGYDALLFPVLSEGRIQYPSNLLPFNAGADGTLNRVRLAREQGFEVGIYFQTFIHGGDPTDPNHVARLHPEWLSYRRDGSAMKDYFSGSTDSPFLDGFFFDPGIPRVHEYLVGILTEALITLSPDWLVLDQVRFPYPEPAFEGTGMGEQPYGFHPIPRMNFKKEWGTDPLESPNGEKADLESWKRSREHSIDGFVERVHDLLVASHPSTRLAAVVHPDPFLARNTLFQNWPEWVRRGWVQAAIHPRHDRGLGEADDADVLAPSIREKVWLAGTLPPSESAAEFLSVENRSSAGWVFFEERPNGFTRVIEPQPPSESLVRTLNEDPPIVVATANGVASDQVWEDPIVPESERVYSAEVRALYGFDPDKPPFDRLTPEGIVEKLKDLGFNAVFGGSESSELRTALSDAGIRRYGEYPVFVGRSYWEDDATSRPISAEGKPYPRQSWYAPLDPHQEWLRQVKKEALIDRVKQEELDGIWLDFIRFPVFWEEVPPKLIESSFSAAALTDFQEQTGIVPEGSTASEMADWILQNAEEQWRRFRADTILSFVDEVAEALRSESPGTLLGAFVLPWSEQEYDNAIYRVAGQDLAGFDRRVDILSPMLYSHQLGRDPAWIQDRVETLSHRFETPIYPIVQCFDQPTPMGEAEVEEAIRNGMLAPSDGVILFSQRHLESTQRWEGVRKVLREKSPPSTGEVGLSTP